MPPSTPDRPLFDDGERRPPIGEWWDRVRFWIPSPVTTGIGRWVVVGGVAFALGACVWIYAASRVPGRDLSPVSLPMTHGAGTVPTGAGADGSVAAPTTTVAPLVVQVAGAVARPGVYRLGTGARVGDLVDAAGGLSVEADQDRINLAAPLTDGVRIYVLRRGEAEPLPVVGGESGTGTGTGGSKLNGAPPAPIDLNTATVDQLDQLPGVGPATAAAIVDDRRDHGPFKSVEDLARVRGIGPAKLAALRSRVRV